METEPKELNELHDSGMAPFVCPNTSVIFTFFLEFARVRIPAAMQYDQKSYDHVVQYDQSSYYGTGHVTKLAGFYASIFSINNRRGNITPKFLILDQIRITRLNK